MLCEPEAGFVLGAIGYEANPHEAQYHHRPGGSLRYSGQNESTVGDSACAARRSYNIGREYISIAINNKIRGGNSGDGKIERACNPITCSVVEGTANSI